MAITATDGIIDGSVMPKENEDAVRKSNGIFQGERMP
jgi:hypothetical protein